MNISCTKTNAGLQFKIGETTTNLRWNMLFRGTWAVGIIAAIACITTMIGIIFGADVAVDLTIFLGVVTFMLSLLYFFDQAAKQQPQKPYHTVLWYAGLVLGGVFSWAFNLPGHNSFFIMLFFGGLLTFGFTVIGSVCTVIIMDLFSWKRNSSLINKLSTMFAFLLVSKIPGDAHLASSVLGLLVGGGIGVGISLGVQYLQNKLQALKNA